MIIEKVKSEILWDIVPVFSKQIPAVENEQTLGEITRTFIDVLAKIVFPNEQLSLRSAQPQEAKNIVTEKSKSN